MPSVCTSIRAIASVPSIPMWKTLTQTMEPLRRQRHISIPNSDLQAS